MLSKTAKIMRNYAISLNSGTQAAQAFNVANLKLVGGESIAERIKRDHNDSSSHLRVAEMMVMAGCATVQGGSAIIYGTFTFEDGSSF